MMRVFVSYSAKDGEFAGQINEQLKQAGLQTWLFEDPDKRGGQIYEKITAEINKADAFLVILSPDYLKSETCKHEGSMALNREKSLRKNKPDASFIFVAKVRPIDYSETGFWSDYDCFDLTGANQQDQIRILIARLKDKGMETPALSVAPALDQTSWPSFQNREPELNKVIDNLTNLAGTHFWLVSAAPQMGKTWFLCELARRIQNKDSRWMIRSVDLRNPPDARRDTHVLLSLFFDLDARILVDENEIASNISKSGKPWLVILDSAELLEEKAEENLRHGLSEIYKNVREAGNPEIRVAFVAASRRTHRKWRGILPAPQFGELILSEFAEDVVEIVLRDMAAQDHRIFSDDRYRELARSLYRVTEGLPALLVKYLKWVRDVGYVGLERIKSQKNFNELARPYVRDVLLSEDSLLPSGGRPFERDTLELALLGLSHCRLITRAHSSHAIAGNPTLKNAMAVLNWDTGNLWNSLRDTCLLHPKREFWLVVHPAVRRLLFRYQYPSVDKQVAEHQSAEKFYEEWQGLDRIEQWTFLIERLWHYAEHLRLLSASGAAAMIEQFTVALFSGRVSLDRYTRQDLHDFVQGRVFEAEEGLGKEFQETIEGIEHGLLERLLQIIESSNGEKG